MNVPFRLWALFLVTLCGAVTAFGLQPGFGGLPWPVAGLWAAAVLAPFGLSVWVAGCLIALGVTVDFMTEAPVGAWPLAFLSAYGVGLVAWDGRPPVQVIVGEAITVIGGMIAAGIALIIAGTIAGHPGFARDALINDFLLTAAVYPVIRYLLIPADIRKSRSTAAMTNR
jgi:hypothetical protein